MAAQLGDDVLPDAVGGHVEGAAKLAEADGFIGLSEERGIRLGSKPLDVDLVLLVLSILLHVALMPLLPPLHTCHRHGAHRRRRDRLH